MDEYKSRLSDYLSDMIREELEKYDGGFTDEWNDQRKKNAEVLGYKLHGKSDIKEAKSRLQSLRDWGKMSDRERSDKIDKFYPKKTRLASLKIWQKLSDRERSDNIVKVMNESVNEGLQNSQGEQTDFKKGDLVKDINPDCPHHGSEGKVTKVGKGTITFDVTNNGRTYKEGDELEKTVDQMVKLKESVNESDLGLTYKKGKTIKVTHKKSGKELVIIDKPNVRREYQKIGYFAEGTVNELQMSPFSSQEAKKHIDYDIKKMSKELGNTSHDIIKMMMDGVKGGKYTAMDIARGVKEGPAGRTHFGELTFIQSLWNKVRDKFRRYSKHGKLS